MPSLSSLAPLPWTYSALSSLLSTGDGDSTVNPKHITIEPVKSSSRTASRYSFLIRVAIFALLESGFIALVSAALRRPIILDLSFTFTEVKSTVTVMAILWHALAVFIVKDILLNIFSAEWAEQQSGSETLSHQELDIVSHLTAGFIDQVKHCVSRRATRPFRLDFVSLLLLILLKGLGPSAISVDEVPYEYPDTIQVANLTLRTSTVDDSDMIMIWNLGLEDNTSARSSAIIQLEVVEHLTTAGFTV